MPQEAAVFDLFAPAPDKAPVGPAASAVVPAWYASHVTTNHKGGLDVDLNQLTIVVGDNEAGKTRLVQAIERATMASRKDWPAARGLPETPAELMIFAPEGASEWFTEVQLSGSDLAAPQRARYAVSGSTKKGKKPEAGSTGVPCGLALDREAAALLALGTDAMRQRLLQLVTMPGLLGAVASDLPTELRGAWEKIVLAVVREAESTPADVLIAAVDAVKEDLKVQRATKKAVDKLETTRAWTGRPVADIEKALASAKALVTAASRRAGAVDRIAVVRARIEALEVEAQAFATGAAVGAALPEPPSAARIASGTALVEALRLVLSRISARPSWPFGREVTPEELAAASAEAERLAGEVTQAARARRAFDEQARASGAAFPRADELSSLKDELRGLEPILAEAAPQNVPLPEQIVALESELAEARRVTAAHTAYKDQMQAASTAIHRETVLVGIQQVVGRQIGERLEEPLRRTFNEVNDLVFGATALRGLDVQLFDGSRKVCRIGFARREAAAGVRDALALASVSPFVSVKALSGAARWLALVAVAHLIGRRASEPFRPFQVDDVWLKAGHARQVCAALERAQRAGSISQAIVYMVEPPHGFEMPAGWKVVEVG